MKKSKQFKTMDQYIKSFPKEQAERLLVIRKIVKELAPKATEVISYNIPTFKMNGKYLVYMAAFKKHTSIYPFTSSVGLTKKEIEKYKKGRGTLQFPMDQKLPISFIQKIVKNKVKEELKRLKATR